MTTVDVREFRPSDWADVRRCEAAGIDTALGSTCAPPETSVGKVQTA